MNMLCTDCEYVSLRGADIPIRLGQKALSQCASLTGEVLIIHGARDRATDYGESKRLAQKLNAKFLSLAQSSHMILWDHEATIAERAIF